MLFFEQLKLDRACQTPQQLMFTCLTAVLSLAQRSRPLWGVTEALAALGDYREMIGFPQPNFDLLLSTCESPSFCSKHCISVVHTVTMVIATMQQFMSPIYSTFDCTLSISPQMMFTNLFATPLGNQNHPSLKVIIVWVNLVTYQQEMQLWRGHQQVEAAGRFIVSRVNQDSEGYTPKEITCNPHLLIPVCTLYLAAFQHLVRQTDTHAQHSEGIKLTPAHFLLAF